MKIEDLRLGRKVRFRHGRTEYVGKICCIYITIGEPFGHGSRSTDVSVSVDFLRKNGHEDRTDLTAGRYASDFAVSGTIIKHDSRYCGFEFVEEEQE